MLVTLHQRFNTIVEGAKLILKRVAAVFLSDLARERDAGSDTEMPETAHDPLMTVTIETIGPASCPTPSPNTAEHQTVNVRRRTKTSTPKKRQMLKTAMTIVTMKQMQKN